MNSLCLVSYLGKIKPPSGLYARCGVRCLGYIFGRRDLSE